jgi:hypothetical protein
VDITQELKKYATTIDTNNFNITIFTDGHYDAREKYYKNMNSNYITGKMASKYIPIFAKILDGIPDVMHLNGDNINGVMDNLYSGKAQNNFMIRSWLSTIKHSYKSATIGNHDDLSPVAILKGSQYVTDNNDVIDVGWFKSKMNNDAKGFYHDKSLSFYKDFPDKKIRFILLDTEEPPVINDEFGKILYPRWLWHGVTNNLLYWLSYKALQNIPEDFTTFIVTHCPIWCDDELDYKWSDTGANMVNFDALRDIINAFISGNKYSIKRSDKEVNRWLKKLKKINRSELYGTGWGLKLDVDFSNQGPRKLAGVFSGHTHKEELADLGSFKNIQLQHGFPNTDNGAPGLTTVSINTKNQEVDLLGFGIASNRSYKY